MSIGEPVDIGIGAALVAGADAWVLVEDRHERSLGVGLAWMHRAGATRLHLLTNERGGSIARRAGYFDLDIGVWEVRERLLVRSESSSHLPEETPRESHLEFSAAITRCGADVVVEHGVVSGEVIGLEVCRVVDDPISGRPRLEVGVGVHDREAFALMHGETPAESSLERIVGIVRSHRRPQADPHPLNRLATERSLRHRIVLDPSAIGARDLRSVSTAIPRSNVKDSMPCAALGTTLDGDPLVAVFSTGIDLDVVPFAADIRSWHGIPDAQLAIVVPERDASPVTKRLVSMLHRPGVVVAIDPADSGSRSLTS